MLFTFLAQHEELGLLRAVSSHLDTFWAGIEFIS